MKRLTVALATATILTLAPATPATAGGCVSNPEYKKVANGWTKGAVHDLFDISGQSIFRDGDIAVRSYNACDASGYTAVQVFYVWLEAPTSKWLVYDKRRY